MAILLGFFNIFTTFILIFAFNINLIIETIIGMNINKKMIIERCRKTSIYFHIKY